MREQGGTVTIESPDEETRALYRRLVHAAKQHHLVPAGFHLKHTGRNSGDLIVRLSDDSAPDETDWNRVRLNTRLPCPLSRPDAATARLDQRNSASTAGANRSRPAASTSSPLRGTVSRRRASMTSRRRWLISTVTIVPLVEYAEPGQWSWAI